MKCEVLSAVWKVESLPKIGFFGFRFPIRRALGTPPRNVTSFPFPLAPVPLLQHQSFYERRMLVRIVKSRNCPAVQKFIGIYLRAVVFGEFIDLAGLVETIPPTYLRCMYAYCI